MIAKLFEKITRLASSGLKYDEKSRHDILEDLLKVSPEDAALREELEGRLERLRAQGVVSISGGIHNNQPGSSTIGKLRTLNNVIRQYEEGKGEVKTIGPKL